MVTVNKEELKDGKVLKFLKCTFLENPSIENLTALIACLIDSELYVPMNLSLSTADEEKFMNSEADDTVKLKDKMRMKPDWLKIDMESEELFFPIFSSISEVPENYYKNFSWINLPLSTCLEFARSNSKCIGFVLDAYTENFILTGQELDYLEKILNSKQINDN